jgi:signal transduction histidine kinase
MVQNILATEFAPAERASVEQLGQESALLSTLPLRTPLLDSVPDIVVIVNRQRQIVFANQAVVEAFGLSDRQSVYGLRPGEALDCVHASSASSHGCGTTSFCASCGAVNAILSGLRGQQRLEECRITQAGTMDAIDLRVAATPFVASRTSFVVFVATDISHEKRRNVLERIFFHDLANTLNGVVGYTDLLLTAPPHRQQEFLDKLAVSVRRLHEEVDSQRALVAAENGTLTIEPLPFSSMELLREVVAVFSGDQGLQRVEIELDASSVDVRIASDKPLLARVLGNMLKNAIEASRAGERVRVGCRAEGTEHLCFWTWNAQAIPREVQLQLFNRSFSTKGKGRGIGTYSMRLLTERYLGGRVAFTSSPEEGTVFSATVPLTLPQP